jgi:hypothetical protein
MFKSPVKEPQIRDDPQGDGHFLASRGERFHRGLDLVVVPREVIFSPISGKIIRKAYPYASDRQWEGVLIKSKHYWVKMFYMVPLEFLIGRQVDAGDPIGFAQDIRNKYNQGMLPHIHLAVMIPPMQTLTHDGKLMGNEIFINPEPLVFYKCLSGQRETVNG